MLRHEGLRLFWRADTLFAMQTPPPLGPPPAYRSNAPPPPFAPSREAMEAERLAKEARERRQANDDLVITIYRVCGLLAVGIGIVLFFISAKSGTVIAGKIIFRTLVFGGTGGGLFVRGNALARRRQHLLLRDYPVMPTYPQPMNQQPFVPSQPPPQAGQPQAPDGPAPITRWTD